MFVTQEKIEKAKTLAMKKYGTWGQWVIETMDDDDIDNEMTECNSFRGWVRLRRRVASAFREIERTAF